jgi:hypothetical protein
MAGGDDRLGQRGQRALRGVPVVGVRVVDPVG